MSLFNVCTWWSAQCSDLGENYDVASLLCARFGLEDQEKDYIVIGTHAGHLSIYYPSYELDATGNTYGYRATDLLLEQQGNSPILGVYAGRFTANSRKENANQLAVLHPYMVVIYSVQFIGGVAEHGAQLSLQQLHAYRFNRTAFALCKGYFGKVKGREFFCVVHLDGALTFYEQDGISYECKFPGHRALPTPIVYCERTDSFFRLASAWNLECFTYQDLSHSSINKSQYQSTWSMCLGEGILDMNVVQVKSDHASLMILGERNFLCVTDAGKLEFILKLEYVPKCFYSFVVGYYWEPTARLITIIFSASSKLFIYEKANIIWAAHIKHEPPVAIQRSNLSGLTGALVTLGPCGQLRIGYLGTDPYVFQVPPLNVQELSFTEAQKKLQELEEEIKEATDIQNVEIINQKAYEDMNISFTINAEVKAEADLLLLEDIPVNVALKELSVSTGQLRWHAKEDLSEMQIVFNMPEGIRCSHDTVTYVNVKGDTSETMELEFFIAELLHFHTSKVEVVVSFISMKGVPRVIQQAAFLPLNMFFKLKQPQKAASIKLTYIINLKVEESPKLCDYFSEFISWENESQSLGLVLLTTLGENVEEIVTIVAEKNSNRLRLESDVLEAFPLVLERLIYQTLEAQKLILGPRKATLKGQINPNADYITASAFIPVQPILHRIDIHHETQENIRKQTLELDELWQRFKELQRRLQEKVEDEPKEILVLQIEENYDHLIAEGDRLTEMRKHELKQRCDLTCALTVAKLIISSLKLEEKLVNIISSVLTTPSEDWTELSWEESMAAGIDMLHHYGPLSSTNTNNQHSMIDSNINTEKSFDYKRFRRNVAILFERIVRLASNDQQLAEVQIIETTMPKSSRAEIVDQSTEDMANIHEILNVQPMTLTTAPVRRLRPYQRSCTLEAVEDDDEEEATEDEEDLRKMGYKKHYGCKEINKENNDATPWVNEDFKLPESDELFNDLGIWW
uniref:Protein PTHB1 n=1 Tax=Glossina palpalis gambiensis TaxID=67801 RepID=A0A1B0B5V8_9MUSC